VYEHILSKKGQILVLVREILNLPISKRQMATRPEFVGRLGFLQASTTNHDGYVRTVNGRVNDRVIMFVIFLAFTTGNF